MEEDESAVSPNSWIYYDDDDENNDIENVQKAENVERAETNNNLDELVTCDFMQYNDSDDAVANDELEHKAFVNDMSQHICNLKETFTDDGQLIETYFCVQCATEFQSLEEFLECHPDGSSSMADGGDGDDDVKAWDLVEDLEAIEYDDYDEKVEHIEDSLITCDSVDLMSSSAVPTMVFENNSTVDITNNSPDVDVNEDAATADISKCEIDSADRYFCYECQQVFNDYEEAEQHECTIVENANMLENQETAENSELPQLTEAEESIDFLCAHCKKSFETYDTLLTHITDCAAEHTTDGGELQKYKKAIPMDSSNGNTYFPCHICAKVFTSARSYYNHKRVHNKSEDGGAILTIQKTTDESSICDICNTKFASVKNLKLHMRIHNKRSLKSIQEALPKGAQAEYNELNQFYCEICNKSFDQNLLETHKNMHQNVEEYNCSICNKVFNNKSNYEMHLRMHADHPTTSKKQHVRPASDQQINSGIDGKSKYPCQYCSKEFQRPYEKVKHERIHTGEKPYECEVCGKTFRVSYSLTLHLRTHTDIRPYVCATCHKRFKQNSVYVHHLKTHQVEKDYKCDICPKSFRTLVQLAGHKNSHRKPYNCTECNRPFSSLYSVKIHMKTHNKVPSNNNNNNSTKISSKTCKNQCHLCGAEYARTDGLRFHLKEQHNLELHASHLVCHDKQHRHDDDYSIDDFFENQDIDETQAATQTILKDEVIVDNFHSEEIITDF